MELALLLATSDLQSENYLKPLGLGYLKSYAKKALPDINITIYDDLEALIKGKPDIVGFSTSTENFGIALKHVKRVKKELKVPVLLGGIHISLIPETVPHGVIGCIGDAEETLVELMEVLISSGKLDFQKLSKIRGLIYYDNDGKLNYTEPRALISPLDRIPFPDRDALGMKPYQDDKLYMFTSRGCPYNCKFCITRKQWSQYREFSSEYVIAEMELLINKYKVKHIHFFDDLFIVNRKRLMKIVDGFNKKGFNITTSCAVIANLVDDELCELLKKINTTDVGFGAESFSEPVLKVLKASSVTVAENQKAIDILNNHGINVNIMMVFNAPEETKEDLILSWKAIFNNVHAKKVTMVGWSYLRPYPGCEYWDEAVEKGIVSSNMDWDLFSDWHNRIFHMNDNMTVEEVSDVVKEWQTKCYLSNLNFRGASAVEYHSKCSIFIRDKELIETICAREEKDDSDLFVAREYSKFREQLKENALSLVLEEGWEPINEGAHWINKKAAFHVPSPMVTKDFNLLNMVFFIPDITYYSDNNLKVTLEIGNNNNSRTVYESGFHTLSVPIPFIDKNRPLIGKITCSDVFTPAKISDSADIRNLSVLVSRFEMAKEDSENVVCPVPIME